MLVILFNGRKKPFKHHVSFVIYAILYPPMFPRPLGDCSMSVSVQPHNEPTEGLDPPPARWVGSESWFGAYASGTNQMFFLKKPWSFLWIDSGWNCGISIFHLNVFCINGLQTLKMIKTIFKTYHIVWFPIPSKVAKIWIWDDSTSQSFRTPIPGELKSFWCWN